MDIDKRLQTVGQAILDINPCNIKKAVEVIKTTLEKDGRIYVFGNGGSAATASHFKNDLEKYGCMYAKKILQVECLNDNVPLITALANDLSYSDIFQYQLFSKINSNDIVIAISTSGNSSNVIKAVAYAKSHGASIIGMTGGTGGTLREFADISLHTSILGADNIEDVHSVMCHTIASALHDIFKITN